MSVDEQVREKVVKYLARSRQALETGRLVLEHEDYIAAVNRAYYAIFYAANAMLTPKGWSEASIPALLRPSGSILLRRASLSRNSVVFMARQFNTRHERSKGQ
jgi:uncharacterized protein (UPF0332 family)